MPKGRSPNSTQQLKKRMLVALEKTLGVVTPAAKLAGINPCTHYDWLKKDASYKEAVGNVKEQTIDFVESQMLKAVKEGDKTLMMFYMKCQAKHRGYVERQELVGVKDQPIEINVVIGQNESKSASTDSD